MLLHSIVIGQESGLFNDDFVVCIAAAVTLSSKPETSKFNPDLRNSKTDHSRVCHHLLEGVLHDA